MFGEKAVKGLRPFAPQPFGRYTLLAPLASGGMGEVYLGRLEGVQGFEKLVVIKKILPQLAHDQDFRDRFISEARVLVKLHHGSVAQVLDMGELEGEYYIALEFVDGKDLRKVAARCKERGHTVPLGLTLFVMMRVLDALAYAHRKKGDDEKDLNLVHRDVSPQNVLISYEGEVKVIDFGLAKSALSLGRTSPSVVLGKFFYMSPEQAQHGKVDRRSDLYAAGICLYELIAGKNPFEHVPQGELMASVAHPRIEALGQAMPGVPAVVEDLVMRALSVDPKDRFHGAEEMRGRVMAAMLELDPAAGPESLAHFMRAVFTNEYGQERRVFTSLRERAAKVERPEAPAGSNAPTGVMPALRLARDEEATAAPHERNRETVIAEREAPLTPAAAVTNVGPLPSNLAPKFDGPTTQQFSGLPMGRGQEPTRPADPNELADALGIPDPTMNAPTEAGEFQMPDSGLHAIRRSTDPAQAPLPEPEELAASAEFGPTAEFGALPPGQELGELGSEPVPDRLPPPPSVAAGSEVLLPEPEEFKLDEPRSEPSLPVISAGVLLDDEPPAAATATLLTPSAGIPLPPPSRDSGPPVLTPSAARMPAAPRAREEAPQPPPVTAPPTVPAPRVSQPAIARPAKPELPKIVVAPDLAEAAERIETLSTRPLMGVARAKERSGDPAEPKGRERQVSNPQRKPQSLAGIPRPKAEPLGDAPTPLPNVPAPGSAMPGAPPSTVVAEPVNTKKWIFLGLAIGAGVVLIGCAIAVALGLFHGR